MTDNSNPISDYQALLNQYSKQASGGDPPKLDEGFDTQLESGMSNIPPGVIVDPAPPEPTITRQPVASDLPPATLPPPVMSPTSDPPKNNIFKFLFFVSLVFFVLFVVFLGYSFLSRKPSSGTTKVSPTPVQSALPTPTSTVYCTLNDHRYAANDSFTATDGCNTCTCTADQQIVCTTLSCDVTPTSSGSAGKIPADWKTYSDSSSSLSFQYPPIFTPDPKIIGGSHYTQEFTDKSGKYSLSFMVAGNYNQITGTSYPNIDEYIAMPYRVSQVTVAGLDGRQPLPRAGSENENNVSFLSADKSTIYSIDLKTGDNPMNTSESAVKAGQQIFSQILSTFKFADTAATSAASWKTFTNKTFGYTVDVPSFIVQLKKGPSNAKTVVDDQWNFAKTDLSLISPTNKTISPDASISLVIESYKDAAQGNYDLHCKGTAISFNQEKPTINNTSPINGVSEFVQSSGLAFHSTVPTAKYWDSKVCFMKNGIDYEIYYQNYESVSPDSTLNQILSKFKFL
jgi:hypothetical protein